MGKHTHFRGRGACLRGASVYQRPHLSFPSIVALWQCPLSTMYCPAGALQVLLAITIATSMLELTSTAEGKMEQAPSTSVEHLERQASWSGLVRRQSRKQPDMPTERRAFKMNAEGGLAMDAGDLEEEEDDSEKFDKEEARKNDPQPGDESGTCTCDYVTEDCKSARRRASCTPVECENRRRGLCPRRRQKSTLR